MVSKAASSRKILGVMSGCLCLKSFKVGSKAFESASDLSLSGDLDFFNGYIRIRFDIVFIIEINGTDNSEIIS